jgi:glycosyltransferase involved in cell wall biosynthesis
VFVSPRKLSTPVSSYLEAMGCGLPVLGYGNAMWSRMQAESGGGWVVGQRPGALVEAVERLHANREAVIAASAKAVDFARANAFESAFARRMNDLRDIAGV